MYYEVVTIREYSNKNKPYCQIRLLKTSKFNKPSEVALVDVSEAKETNKKLKALENNETEAKYEELVSKYNELLTKHNDLTEAYSTLEEENNKLVAEAKEDKQKLLNASNEDKSEEYISKLEAKAEEITELNNKLQDLTEAKAEEIAELNNKIYDINIKLNNEKDFSKALLVAMNDLNKRNFLDRLRNKEPESVKIITTLKLPENITEDTAEE